MKPFTVLGYSANDEVFCRSCLRSTTGLGPSCLDYNSRPILPLYAGDLTVHEECCTYCGRSLLELRLVTEADRAKAAPAFQVAKTRHRGRQPALRFDHRPPVTILNELKESGWRWDASARLWWWPKGVPVAVPVVLGLPPPAPRVSAHPPVIRRRAVLAAASGSWDLPAAGMVAGTIAPADAEGWAADPTPAS